MRIVLFSPYSCLSNIGVRILSAVLKKNGHQVRTIFAPLWFEPEEHPRARLYPEAMRDQLLPLLDGTDLVGMTLMTDYYAGSRQVAGWIRQSVPAPLVWGGVHPTLAPGECLESSDYVVVGEAEDSLVELAVVLGEGGDPSMIPAVHGHRGGVTFSNPVRPLRMNLDELPFPDYDPSDQFLFHDGRFKEMNDVLMQENLAIHRGSSNPAYRAGYQILTGRGCPHRCTYCINHALSALYPGQRHLRWRSVGSIISELEAARRAMPYLDHIWISDDSFFSRREEDLREFSAEYKRRVGLPFFCLTSPSTLSEEKLDLLMDAGLFAVQMGVETMSANTARLYGRQFMSNDRVIWAMELLSRHRDRLGMPQYDLIYDNPFESRDDELETLRMISRIPRPYHLSLWNLRLYPGTALFELAEEKGIVPREGDLGERWFYLRPSKFSYTEILLRLFKEPRLPGWILRLLISRPLPQLFGLRIFQPLGYLFSFLRRSHVWLHKVLTVTLFRIRRRQPARERGAPPPD